MEWRALSTGDHTVDGGCFSSHPKGSPHIPQYVMAYMDGERTVASYGFLMIKYALNGLPGKMIV